MTDEEITDRIADEVAERIVASHPTASQRFRRVLVSLYTAQACGAELPPGSITDKRLAAWLGETPQSISQARATGLARAWKAYSEQFPELIEG